MKKNHYQFTVVIDSDGDYDYDDDHQNRDAREPDTPPNRKLTHTHTHTHIYTRISIYTIISGTCCSTVIIYTNGPESNRNLAAAATAPRSPPIYLFRPKLSIHNYHNLRGNCFCTTATAAIDIYKLYVCYAFIIIITRIFSIRQTTVISIYFVFIYKSTP